MKMNKKKVGLVALTSVLAISALNMGFASWETTITGNGNVSAKGNWEVTVTEASLNLSTGAALEDKPIITYEMERTNVKGDSYIASVISANE